MTMTTSHLLATAAATLMLGVAPLSAVAQSSGEMAGRMAMQPGQLPEPVKLADSDVTGFIQVVEDLRQLGIEMDAKTLGQGPSLGQSMEGREQVMRTLDKAGFDPQRLQQVGYSVALALAALTQDMEEMEQRMAQMEQMKSQMTPEQWAMVSANMGAALQMMEQLRNQPEGNMAVVEKHQATLEQLLGSN